MKTITRVTVGIVALGAFSLPATTASADPGMCGRVITTPGTVVTLTDNLKCAGTALTVAADNVTIDLAGFTIKGRGSDPVTHITQDPRNDGHTMGIYVKDAKGAHITRGTVYGFDAGVVADKAIAMKIDNATVTMASLANVWAVDSKGISVEKSKIEGPWVDGDPFAVAEGIYVTNGLWVSHSSGLTILDSAITGIRGSGVFTDHVTGLTVTGSHLVDNAGDGLQSFATGGDFTVRDTVATATRTDSISHRGSAHRRSRSMASPHRRTESLASMSMSRRKPR